MKTYGIIDCRSCLMFDAIVSERYNFSVLNDLMFGKIGEKFVCLEYGAEADGIFYLCVCVTLVDFKDIFEKSQLRLWL